MTVVDYFSRNLLVCHLTHSYSAAEVSHDLKLGREAAERIHGPHWALIPDSGGDPLVPAEVYAEAREIHIPRWQP
ncbi:hypothetical protein GC170_09165 [bacterium]|nr:hypothetical protein [bacterium]